MVNNVKNEGEGCIRKVDWWESRSGWIPKILKFM